jgi:D-alanyl-D-alanine-carboxypeptidase/D-alanyl-D-alanine-endopeptidase
MRPSLALLALALWPALGVVPAGLVAQGTLPPDSVVRALMDARLKLLPNSGMVIGLIDANGGRVLSAGAVNGPGTPAPDSMTVFEIGSITKTFTATLLADMVRRGEVQLAEPVAKLLPLGTHVPERGGKQITLLDLATQSSGLPRVPSNLKPANMADPYADYTVRQLYDFLASYQLPRDPGAQYEYSNLGVGLLGLALARRAGTSYEQAIEARVAGPLGMADTRITLTPSERGRLAPGHDAAGETVPNWSLPTFAGAGALRSTPHDMMLYLAANLAADSATSIGRDMRDARRSRRPTTIASQRIGLVWMTHQGAGEEIVWHNGGTGGYHAFIGFDPRRHVGVVMLGNNQVSTDDICFHILDPSVPITPPPPPPPKRTAVALTAAQLAPYVGRYELAPGAIMAITLDGTQLFEQLTGQPAFPIFALSVDHFFLKVVDATIDFERDAQGNVVSLVLHQNGRDVPAKRMVGGARG